MNPTCTWTLYEPPSGWTSARTDAFAIRNNGSIVVGRCTNNSGTYRAMRWVPSTPTTDLQTLNFPDNPSYFSEAYGINKDGYVVGRANFPGGGSLFHAFRCLPGGLISDRNTPANDLGTIGTGQTSTAYAINDFRQIVGETKIDSQYPYNHAFIKTPDSNTGQGFTDLGALLTGYAASAAHSINNFGQVVGSASVTSYTGFIWQDDLGMKRLQDLLPSGSQWTITGAEAINDQGVIVGWGYPCPTCTYAHAYMMTP